MHLLVTNDDGIDSIFLHELVHALRSAGHTLAVVAPASEQSWIGAGKSRNRAVSSCTADRSFGCPTWIVDGTPSDCVNIALAHLLPDPAIDGVVSGINIGRNASLAFILASGTVAGAWEGALHGLPAVALSQDLTVAAYDQLKYSAGQPDAALLGSLRATAAHAARFVPELIRGTCGRSFIVHNLNYPFPCRADAPVRRTVPARTVLPRLFSPRADDGTHRFVFRIGEDFSPELPLSDNAALEAGAISHCVLDYSQLGHA
jgi:5'-nucleotidase